ncbi:hypothetical protein AAG906_027155 [Vitis piasezkii]
MQLTRFFHFVFYLLREGRELMHHHCYPGLSCDLFPFCSLLSSPYLAGAYSSMGAINFSPRARRTTKKRYLIVSSIY